MAKERAERNTFRIRLDTVLSHSGRAIGWLGLVFWGAVGAAGFAELAGGADRAVDRVMPFLCLFFAALHVLLVLSSARLRALIRDFRHRHIPAERIGSDLDLLAHSAEVAVILENGFAADQSGFLQVG